MDHVVSGRIIPLINQDILEEYSEVLRRNKFGIPEEVVSKFLALWSETGIFLDREKTLEDLPVRRINEQMKRNPDRFPEDFCFQLTQEEAMSLSRSQFAITMQTKGTRVVFPQTSASGLPKKNEIG